MGRIMTSKTDESSGCDTMDLAHNQMSTQTIREAQIMLQEEFGDRLMPRHVKSRRESISEPHIKIQVNSATWNGSDESSLGSFSPVIKDGKEQSVEPVDKNLHALESALDNSEESKPIRRVPSTPRPAGCCRKKSNWCCAVSMVLLWGFMWFGMYTSIHAAKGFARQ